MPRACRIGSYTSFADLFFEAAPPDLRKVFRPSGGIAGLGGASPLAAAPPDSEALSTFRGDQAPQIVFVLSQTLITAFGSHFALDDLRRYVTGAQPRDNVRNSRKVERPSAHRAAQPRRELENLSSCQWRKAVASLIDCSNQRDTPRRKAMASCQNVGNGKDGILSHEISSFLARVLRTRE